MLSFHTIDQTTVLVSMILKFAFIFVLFPTRLGNECILGGKMKEIFEPQF